MNTEQIKKTQQIVEKLSSLEGPLLPILHAVQDYFGHVPKESVPVIAKSLNLSRAEVQGVISFYHGFREQPTGRYVLQICRAEACQAMGGRQLENHARQRLGIDFGETTEDGKVTLEPVYCLGNCACSPSVRVGDQVYARVDNERFDQLLAKMDETGGVV
ncbi:MAG: formate dehydrogenase subunit gamma [Pseudomonadales bacterium]|nr:formate dehydrogenase subunit gamma [Pseudomonadales bacterium]